MTETEVFAPSDGIVILGMHRSGTSAFAGILHLLGFDFGDDLLEGNKFNQGGYWENRAIVRLNDRLLNYLGACWSDVQIAPYCLPDLQKEFGSEARALLERTFSGKKNWALKDPRLCLLMDFWREIFAQRNISLIHIVRDPLAVAHSLYRRDRFPIERGLLLWLSQNLNAEFFTRGYRRCFVNYEDFTTGWRRALSVAFQQLNIRPQKNFEDAADDIEVFLGIKSNPLTGGTKSRISNHQSRLVSETYDVLRRATICRQAELEARCDELGDRFRDLGELFFRSFHADHVQAELKSTRERLAALAAKEAVMRRKLDERSAYRQLARRTNTMWMQLFLYGWIWRFWWVWIPVLLLPCWIYD